MIVKAQDKSLYISKLEALNRRLANTHKQKTLVEDTLIKELSGLKGQNALNFHLNLLPQDEYLIIHNLRLQDSNDYFEIDTLLMCERYILLIESKNWYGTLYFDGDRQVIRVGDDGKEEGFPNPIPQVKTQRFRLQKWLSQHNLLEIPLLYLVVISFPSTIIKSLDNGIASVPSEVIHSNSLFFKIEELNKTYFKQSIKMKRLIDLSTELVTAHCSTEVNILTKFGINKNELIIGAMCSQCRAIPMKKLYGKWECISCGYQSKTVFVNVFRDYKLLIDEYITNREARRFLMVDSPNVVKNYLSEYEAIGNKGMRKYRIK